MRDTRRGSPFTDRLEAWLQGSGPKTIAGLEEVFARRSLAIAIMLLMVFPALPLPTGGISHVFEVIAMLLALELALGAKGIWLPRRWMHAPVPARITRQAVPLVLKAVRRYETWSNPRGRRIFSAALTHRLAGLLLFVFALAAFLAPPFSGIDTLPALGALMVGLALIFEDIVLLAVGTVVGAAGVGLVVAFASLTVAFVRRWL